MIRWFFAVVVLVFAAFGGARAQDLSALAQVDPARSHLSVDGSATEIVLGLSQPVPFRAFLLDAPRRLVVDFREVDFTGLDAQALRGGAVASVRWGAFRPGWSRLVAELDGAVAITEAEERTGEASHIRIRLSPVHPDGYSARAGAPDSALWDLPQPAPVSAPHRRQTGERPLFVVLDPGHGGIDPGAEAGDLREADLVLSFARQLADEMRRAGIRVLLTRESDVFVPLETRVTVARVSGADLFLSLHADALEEGGATGATLYLLLQGAGDGASRRLAERHDRADLLAGVDLTGHGDEVAGVLMDLARHETRPRSERVARELSAAIAGAGLKMHKRPVQGADFSVLKSPDIPSVLLELGFLSSPADRKRLIDPDWRATMAQALTRGILRWGQADAAEARLLRQ